MITDLRHPKVQRVRLGTLIGWPRTLGQVTPAAPQPTLYEALQAAGPTIIGLSNQYKRAAPLLDKVIDHPYLSVAVFIGSISLAALFGAWIGASGVIANLFTSRS